MAIVLAPKDVPIWDGKRTPQVGEVLYVQLENLRGIGNPRNDINQEDIATLLKSIKAIGQLQDSTVIIQKEGKGKDEKIVFGVAGGNQRWAACQLGKIPMLRCKVADPKSKKDLFLLKAADNCARTGYSLFDTVNMIRDGKKEHGMSDADLAETMGWTVSYVIQLSNMLKLHPDILERTRPSVPECKRLSLSVAQPLCGLPHKLQLELIDRVTGGISADRARAIIDHLLAEQGLVRAGSHRRSPSKKFRNVASFSKVAIEKLTLLLGLGPEKYAEMLEHRDPADILKHLADIEKLWNMTRMLHERMRKARNLGKDLETKDVPISLLPPEPQKETEIPTPPEATEKEPIHPLPKPAGSDKNGKAAPLPKSNTGSATSPSRNGSGSSGQPRRHTTQKQRREIATRKQMGVPKPPPSPAAPAAAPRKEEKPVFSPEDKKKWDEVRGLL